jgi:hypothetical protein
MSAQRNPATRAWGCRRQVWRHRLYGVVITPPRWAWVPLQLGLIDEGYVGSLELAVNAIGDDWRIDWPARRVH